MLPTVSTSVALAAPHERHYYTLHDIQLHHKNNCCIRNSTVPCTLAITVSTGITKIKMRSETGRHLFLHCFTYLNHISTRFTSCLIKIVEFFNINFLKCVFYYTSCLLNTCFPYKFIYGKMYAGFYDLSIEGHTYIIIVQLPPHTLTCCIADFHSLACFLLTYLSNAYFRKTNPSHSSQPTVTLFLLASFPLPTLTFPTQTAVLLT